MYLLTDLHNNKYTQFQCNLKNEDPFLFRITLPFSQEKELFINKS